MPQRPLRPCAHPGCPALVRDTPRCEAHARPAWAHSASRQARGYDADHDRLRRQVLSEEPCCRSCGSTEQPTLDHVVPLSQGGATTRENAQRLCRRCQQRKASREGAAAREKGAA